MEKTVTASQCCALTVSFFCGLRGRRATQAMSRGALGAPPFQSKYTPFSLSLSLSLHTSQFVFISAPSGCATSPIGLTCSCPVLCSLCSLCFLCSLCRTSCRLDSKPLPPSSRAERGGSRRSEAVQDRIKRQLPTADREGCAYYLHGASTWDWDDSSV